mmetsp:Transcript_18850/g.32203  ORF Transcript_18850/g.32203 Transcript_18850/m.32203 type:complete len:124 (+) Transcript_18850:90-461(+)
MQNQARPSSAHAGQQGTEKQPPDTHFDKVYAKALLRKKLFKEYIIAHGVMERLNIAIEALYECEVLPEDPMEFVCHYVMDENNVPAQNRFQPQATVTTNTAGAGSSLKVSQPPSGTGNSGDVS